MGLSGALAFADAPENMLSMLLSPRVGVLTRLCGTLFGVLIIGFGVPIFCVIARYNLVNGGLCSEGWAHVWSSLLPWATAWTLYQGSVTLKLLSYSGLVLNGAIDFLMPGLVTLVSLGGAAALVSLCRADDHKAGAAAASPIRPFPPWLRPFYFHIIASLVAFLLVVLPVAFWLQLHQ